MIPTKRVCRSMPLSEIGCLSIRSGGAENYPTHHGHVGGASRAAPSDALMIGGTLDPAAPMGTGMHPRQAPSSLVFPPQPF